MTVNRTNPSGMMTSTNARTISTVMMRSLVRRQPAGSRRSAFSTSGVTAISGTPRPPGRAHHDGPGDHVDDDRKDEQQHADSHQRGALEPEGLAELVRDHGGHVVAG